MVQAGWARLASVEGGSKAPPKTGGIGTEPFQSGTLTSGDYDDLLNPEFYQDYISIYFQDRQSTLDIPYVDIISKIAVHITGTEGKPIFGARVKVISQNDVLASLKTSTNGIVNIFPAFDKLPDQFELQVTSPDGTQIVLHPVVLADTPSTIKLELPILEPTVTQLDVGLVIDVTGSMSDELEYLQIELSQIFKDLIGEYAQLNINAGLVAYRDVGDAFVVADYPLAEDIAQFDLYLNTRFQVITAIFLRNE